MNNPSPDSPKTPTDAEYQAMLEADERARRLRTPPDSDLANAEVMALRYEKEIIFVPGMGFLVYRDGVWQRDSDARHVTYLAGEHAKAICEHIDASSGFGPSADALRKAALRLKSDRSISATVRLLRSQPDITVLGTDLNSNSMLFNVANGTIDLRTGDLNPHDPADRITKKSPVRFDRDAQCPMWQDFVEKISAAEFGGAPRPELVALLRRLAGYLLTGDTSEQMLFLFFGDGANGKGTWIEVISAMLGTYATTTNSATFMRTKSDQHPTAVADIAEARFVYCDELAEDAIINEERMKSMTGEGRQKARFIAKDFFEFIPRFKVIFGTNHLPKVPTNDRAIWRRIIPIPFSITIPPERRDQKIVSRLCSELPGILNWAISGCIDWQFQRLDPNSIPCVKNLREDYHEEEDHLSRVLDSICDFGPGFTVLQTDLHMAYRRACQARGYLPLDDNVFGRRLTTMKILPRRIGKRRDRARVGLQLKSEVASEPAASLLEDDDPSEE